MLMDFTKRFFDFITAKTPEELRDKLVRLNIITGRTTDVINVVFANKKWYAFFYNNKDLVGDLDTDG